MRRHEIDITVLGGLPITVSYTIQGPDRSVGIFIDSYEDIVIERINGRKCKNADWIEKKLKRDELLDKVIDAVDRENY